jgi:hypothetical protein
MTRQECDGFLIRIVKLQIERKLRADRWELAELAQRLLAEYRSLYATVLEHRLGLEEAKNN